MLVIAGDGDGACGDRLGDETRTVGLRTRERKKQVAGFHSATVHSETGDADVARGLVDHGIIAEEVAQFHAVPVRAIGLMQRHANRILHRL